MFLYIHQNHHGNFCYFPGVTCYLENITQNLFLCTEIFLQSSYVSIFYYWNHNHNMVHNIEYKRFWCGNRVLLKQDKREFLTDICNKIPDPKISSTISSKIITFKYYKSAHQ